MIDYFDGYIMLAYRNVLIYLKIDKERIDGTKESHQVEAINVQDGTQIKQLNLSKRYKIICIQPLGSLVSSLVLEKLSNRQIRFVRVEPNEQKQRLKFVQLGVIVNHSKLTPSKLLKYRSVSKINEKTKKKYQVGLVVR